MLNVICPEEDIMRRILIPVDGSESALRAVRHVSSLSDLLKGPVEVLLLNVQYPPPANELLINGRPSEVRQMEEPLRTMGEKLLAPARAALEQSKIANKAYVEFGDPAPTISNFAKTYHCELIAMGTRGMGSIASLLLGSVATKVIHLSDAPVMLVR